EPLELEARPSGFDVAAPTLRWSGPFPSLELRVDQPTLVARTESRDAMWWIRVPRLLSYWSAFGPVEFVCGDERVRGLGVVEHAWGAETRLDVARYLPGRWHWDVLAFDDGRWCAALALAVGRTFFGIGSGRVEGQQNRRSWGYALRVDEWSEPEGRRIP